MNAQFIWLMKSFGILEKKKKKGFDAIVKNYENEWFKCDGDYFLKYFLFRNISK